MAVEVISQQSVLVPVGDLLPHPRNARQGDVGAIYESIESTGFYGALVVQKSTGHILSGTHRWKAAQHAGLGEVPVIYVDVDDETALRILLADNRTNDLASYDQEALKDVLEELRLATGSLVGTGFSDEDLDALVHDLSAPMFSPNTSPTLDLTHHTDEDVARAQEKLDTQFDGKRPLKATMCPSCGTEFYVD